MNLGFALLFRTPIVRRDEPGLPGCFDVYYGMADKRIRAARLDLPEQFLKPRLKDIRL